MRDTSTEAAAAQIAAFRRLSPAARVALALEASDWLLAVARARAPGDLGPPSSARASVVDALPAVRESRAR